MLDLKTETTNQYILKRLSWIVLSSNMNDKLHILVWKNALFVILRHVLDIWHLLRITFCIKCKTASNKRWDLIRKFYFFKYLWMTLTTSVILVDSPSGRSRKIQRTDRIRRAILTGRIRRPGRKCLQPAFHLQPIRHQFCSPVPGDSMASSPRPVRRHRSQFKGSASSWCCSVLATQADRNKWTVWTSFAGNNKAP